jgi:hypothetical protein
VDPPRPVTLRCTGGKPAPPGLGEDLGMLLRLPTPALARMGDVLGPCLSDPLPVDAERRLDAFCAGHGISNDALARPLKACRFLLREAACRDASTDALAEDLDALCPEAPIVKQLLLGVYDAARVKIQQDTLRAMLTDHGKLLVDVDWRRDAIEGTSRAPDTRLRVTLLTLRYREGDDTKRITLQVLPETLRRLRACIDQIAT